MEVSTTLWGISPTKSVVIPQSLVTEVHCFELNFNIHRKLVYFHSKVHWKIKTVDH